MRYRCRLGVADFLTVELSPRREHVRIAVKNRFPPPEIYLSPGQVSKLRRELKRIQKQIERDQPMESLKCARSDDRIFATLNMSEEFVVVQVDGANGVSLNVFLTPEEAGKLRRVLKQLTKEIEDANSTS